MQCTSMIKSTSIFLLSQLIIDLVIKRSIEYEYPVENTKEKTHTKLITLQNKQRDELIRQFQGITKILDRGK